MLLFISQELTVRGMWQCYVGRPNVSQSGRSHFSSVTWKWKRS
uniref:Uncharacterized protein n=1 Tax=Anguilla anguilla TaxID=7936 RepID=A0A0E9VTK3_ANGAN